MFVVLSRFEIANGMVEEVRAAFRERPHRVEDAPGFVRMEVMSPCDKPEEVWLLTYWSDADSFNAWHHSHAYKDAHRGIPKGLKLVPRSTELRQFNVFAR
ncbi:antibiotic biosynthesis monooxygenase [Paucibacter sp. B2R-40]|uniref:antibiotic biosynthesis monooxygenase family protein n=1 Tax=Paucibacter sp. B2R-40 TaxID=2893554 RepID=UPI0021E40BA1|nr:antibiotic biosynthesis monooxygenase [Paucibacter sp. B2R-40]MCV2356310.1 antibiotic biosynthesis monooxygenase [Paucibacter sp. B2R-40]